MPNQPAHRPDFPLAHGPIPPGRYVRHRCDKRRCVRPDHLFLVPQPVTLRDKGFSDTLAAAFPQGPGVPHLVITLAGLFLTATQRYKTTPL